MVNAPVYKNELLRECSGLRKHAMYRTRDVCVLVGKVNELSKAVEKKKNLQALAPAIWDSLPLSNILSNVVTIATWPIVRAQSVSELAAGEWVELGSEYYVAVKK